MNASHGNLTQRRSGRMFAAAAVVWLCAPTATADDAARVDFAKQIQPIFVEHCYQCHGPDKQESALRLDLREAALKGGDAGPWFVAGNSRASEMVRRISSADQEERMPPVSPQTKALSPAQIAAIANWIDQGAVWPEARTGSNHWAYQPIQRPAPPQVRDAAWVRSPIDRFVLAQLEARGFAPSPEADRYTLIKRLSYDLLGLPPEVEEVDAFVRDTAADAYENLVNRMLDSPRFGERWARRWLDMARYADSDGYEKDNSRPDAWRYRDWTIDAVNADMPLDRFTIEQLAGDLLPGAGPSERLATAFHRQTLTNTEGGTDQEQFRVEAIFDRVATTGSVWLGLTIGCAQCHSHKYDAITHEEFYRLFAFFDNGDETDFDMPLSGEALDQWTRERDSAQKKLATLDPQLEQARAAVAAKLPAWEAELNSTSATPLEFHPVELVSADSSAGAELKLLSDGSYLVAGKNPDVDKFSITAKTDLAQISGFRVEALAHNSLPNSGPGRSDEGNFVLSEFRAFAAATSEIKSEHRVAFAQAQADFAQEGFLASAALDGKEPTGWGIAPQTGRDHQIVFMAKQPIATQSTPWLKLVLSQNQGARHTIGRFRMIAVTGHDPRFGLPKDVVDILAIPAEKRTSEQTSTLVDYYYTSQEAKAKELVDEVKKLRTRLAAKPVMKVRVIAERTDKRRASHVLHRGDFLQPTTEVQPGTLAVLPPLKPREPGKADRLDLARWLVDPVNPLTRRVMVNQLWSSLFGRPIVRTPNDFGVRGRGPTHPELLDWLAGELVERRWSRKEMIRLIVSSATYRQTSHTRAELADADPLNELLHRQNRFRVEAEIVRDLALAAGGILSGKIGGPSVYPPLPPDIAELSYANNFKWTASTLDDRYRRGMYTFFKRTAPHPNLSTFDCPDSNTTCIERRTSNTPLQALTTLNNETFAEAAQVMAKRALSAAGDDRARLTLALRSCIARPPSAEDLSAFSELLATSRQWYTGHAADATAAIGSFKPEETSAEEAAAWVATVRIMLNLDEFLTRE